MCRKAYSNMADQYPTLFNDIKVIEAEVVGCRDQVKARTKLLSNLVTELGPLLTHKDVSRRQIGLEFLVEVLDKLPKNWISTAECHFLTEFFVDRCKDSPLMYSGIIFGFATIVLKNSDAVEDSDVLKILTSFFNDLHAQSLTVKDRSRIFDILSHCINFKLEVITTNKFSSQFVLGFLQSVEGETNPRNLIVIFSCWPVILTHMDCSVFLEDIFEALACYFPIDFTPSKETAHKITKEDLKQGLHRCLSSSARFAQHAIPLFLEKLSSDLVESKLDSIDSLLLCLPKYAPSQLKPHLQSLWNNIKQEIMGIRANASAEAKSAALDLVEKLTAGLCTATQTAENSAILESWLDLAWKELHPFLKFIESNLMEVSVQIMSRLCASHTLASVKIMNQAFPILLEVQKSSEDKARITLLMKSLLDSCHEFSSTPEWAPTFVSFAVMGSVATNELDWRNSSCLAMVSAAPKLNYPIIIDSVNEAFDLALKQPDAFDQDVVIQMASYLAQSDIERLRTWIQTKIEPSSLALNVMASLCASHSELVDLVATKVIDLGNNNQNEVTNVHLWQFWGKVFDSMDNLDAFEGHEVFSHLMALDDKSGGDSKCQVLSKAARKIQLENFGQRLQSLESRVLDSNDTPDEVVISVLCALHPKVLSLMKLSKEILQPAQAMKSIPTMTLAASVLNKMKSEKDDGQALIEALQKIEVFSSGHALITKALLMRGSPLATPMVLQILEQVLSSPANPSLIAALNALSRDCQYLSKINHHVILPFYKQKYFSIVVPRLMAAFKEGNTSILDVLLQQLPEAPSIVLKAEVSPHLADIVRAIFGSEAKISPSTSNFLSFVKNIEPEVLESLSELIIPSLLRLAKTEPIAMSDQIPCLELLESLASDQVDKTLRKMVVAELLPLLNHKKRLVRKAVVEARNAWMLLS